MSTAEAVVAAVRRFASAELDSKTIEQEKVSGELRARLGELGVFGVTLPQEVGGLGEGLGLAIQVVRALAEADRSVATTVGLHLGLGTRALVRYGQASLLKAYGPLLASGECLSAFATTEPGSGSDLSHLSTEVAVGPKGLRLHGQKSYVTNGAWAGLVTVTARSRIKEQALRETAMVAVPQPCQGLVRGAEEHKLGLRGSSTTGFFLEGVDVPLDHLLGNPEQGAAQLEHTLSWGRTLMSAGCAGAARSALVLAQEHVHNRKQFGKRLDQQPVVRAQLAWAFAQQQAMEALLEEVAAQTEDAELHRWSVSAKLFCSEMGYHNVDTALQLHGAMGYLEDTGLARQLRDLRVTRIFEGANDVLLGLAGSLELRSPRAIPGELAPVLPLSLRVGRMGERLRRQRGVAVFRQPRVLHSLGAEVVWRDALQALAKRVPPSAPALTLLASRRRSPLLSLGGEDHVVEAVLEEAL